MTTFTNPLRLLLALFFSALTLALFSVYSAEVLGHYGYGLFLALPFTVGAVTTSFLREAGPRTWSQMCVFMLFALGLSGLILLATASEGFLCLLMALPLMLMMFLAGVLVALIVDWRQRRGKQTNAPSLMLLAWLFPLFLGMTSEPAILPGPPLRSVETRVVVRGTLEEVWDTVIQFPSIPSAPDGILAWGIAYPISAAIEGEGPGAIRRCTFNTGDFVEPITVWEAPRRLAFDVTENPLPMREWSFHGDIDTPHLHGFLASERGEFRLAAMDGGTVLLSGTTWYRHDLWPQFYWGFLSDQIIHRIHLRVLNHIKATVEAG